MHPRRFLAVVIASLAVGFAVANPDTHAKPGLTDNPSLHVKRQTPDLHRVPDILTAVRVEATNQHDAWFDDGDFPRSIQSLKVLKNLFPSDYQLVTDLGWMCENVHDESSALVLYIEYARAYPDDPEAQYPEAEFYFRNKLYAKVPQILEPVLKMRVHPHGNSYRILARAYEKMDLYEDAKRVWDTYIALVPTDGQAKVNRERVTKKLRTAVRLSNRRDS
jgi:tetratricopeptide (TPR) repeat protein